MTRQFCIYLLLICTLTSCFEVIEDITFKKDGSGTFKFIINLSQSKSEVNSLMKLDSASGYKIPRVNDINTILDQVTRTLKTTEGISNVNLKRNYTDWIFELKMDFKNTQSLDAAVTNLYADLSGGREIEYKNTINYANNTFTRDVQLPDEDAKKEINKPVGKRIFASAKFTTIYRFEKEVSKQTNAKAKVSASKKAVMLQGNVLNLLNGKEPINNTIYLH
jgi:archaellin